MLPQLLFTVTTVPTQYSLYLLLPKNKQLTRLFDSSNERCLVINGGLIFPVARHKLFCRRLFFFVFGVFPELADIYRICKSLDQSNEVDGFLVSYRLVLKL